MAYTHVELIDRRDGNVEETVTIAEAVEIYSNYGKNDLATYARTRLEAGQKLTSVGYVYNPIEMAG